jgi:hypothetical protein
MIVASQMQFIKGIREIAPSIGPVTVRCPRVRDRVGEGSDPIRFSSAIDASVGRQIGADSADIIAAVEKDGFFIFPCTLDQRRPEGKVRWRVPTDAAHRRSS